MGTKESLTTRPQRRTGTEVQLDFAETKTSRLGQIQVALGIRTVHSQQFSSSLKCFLLHMSASFCLSTSRLWTNPLTLPISLAYLWSILLINVNYSWLLMGPASPLPSSASVRAPKEPEPFSLENLMVKFLIEKI